MPNQEKPTNRQMFFICEMQKWLDVPFTGTTKQEASEWIDANLEDYRLLKEGREW